MGRREMVGADFVKEGAADYLAKPLALSELRLLLERLMGQHRLARTVDYYRGRVADGSGLDKLLGASPAMQALRERITLLIEAELLAAALKNAEGAQIRAENRLATATQKLSDYGIDPGRPVLFGWCFAMVMLALGGWSTIDTSTCLMGTAGWLMPSTQALSHGAGHTRPITAGNGLASVRRRHAYSCQGMAKKSGQRWITRGRA